MSEFKLCLRIEYDEDGRRISSPDSHPLEPYLNLSLGTEANWDKIWFDVYNRLCTRYGSDKDAVRQGMRNVFCSAILYPVETNWKPTNAEQCVFHIVKESVFNQKDWVSQFAKIYERDQKIKEWRNSALCLGRIEPLDATPQCTQAFNWLYDRAQKTLKFVTERTREHHKNVVRIYGGECVSNMFLKHTEHVDKVYSWITGYFFEHALFDVYSIEQILKIKTAELKKTDPKFVERMF